MQRLYDDEDFTDVLGYDKPLAPHDIRFVLQSFNPLVREASV